MAAGYQSYSAFWIGGASGFEGSPAPPVPVIPPATVFSDGGGGKVRRAKYPFSERRHYETRTIGEDLARQKFLQQITEEENEIVAIILAIIAC